MRILCKMIGHNWMRGWESEIIGPYGGMIIKQNVCVRCEKETRDYFNYNDPLSEVS